MQTTSCACGSVTNKVASKHKRFSLYTLYTPIIYNEKALILGNARRKAYLHFADHGRASRSICKVVSGLPRTLQECDTCWAQSFSFSFCGKRKWCTRQNHPGIYKICPCQPKCGAGILRYRGIVNSLEVAVCVHRSTYRLLNYEAQATPTHPQQAQKSRLLLD